MADHRQLYRVAIDRTGQIRRGDETFPCNVVDVTEQGVRLQVDGAFRAGEELQLEFTLTDVDAVACAIKVTHCRTPEIGAAIVQIAPDHQRRLSSFIEQLNALNMTGF